MAPGRRKVCADGFLSGNRLVFVPYKCQWQRRLHILDMYRFRINLSYKLITEQKNKKFLKDTFGKYVSPKLIDEMYKNKEIKPTK